MSKAVAERPGETRARGPGAFPETVERGLLALAERNGNAYKAVELLAMDGIKVSDQTLYNWRDKHRERYEAIRADVLPRIQLKAAEDHRALSARCMEAEHLLLDRLIAEIGNLDKRDISTSLRNVSTSGAIHVDKAQILSDQPTEIRRLDTGEVLRKLGSRNMRLEMTERTLVAETTE